MKRALIFDLDNTLFPVESIGDQLFDPLFRLIHSDGRHEVDFQDIKHDVMRKPFQWVAYHYGFSESLTHAGIELMKELRHKGPIDPFEDYEEIKKLSADRFLVTTGFLKMQQSKINGLGIIKDFQEIIVIDPTITQKTKKDIFEEIIALHHLSKEDVLIIGNDPDSEIKAANEIGVESVLYDRHNSYAHTHSTYRISNYKNFPACSVPNFSPGYLV